MLFLTVQRFLNMIIQCIQWHAFAKMLLGENITELDPIKVDDQWKHLGCSNVLVPIYEESSANFSSVCSGEPSYPELIDSWREISDRLVILLWSFDMISHYNFLRPNSIQFNLKCTCVEIFNTQVIGRC